MTIAEALRWGLQLDAVSDSAQLDTELLLAHSLGKTRTYLYGWSEVELTPEQEASFSASFERRRQGEPIAYILGEREFWSLPLLVNTSTLIPRPDTESLVEFALERLPGGTVAAREAVEVLDLGTGTGAVALALASERSDITVQACDKNPDAVLLAQENQCRLTLQHVKIYTSDWFSNVDGLFNLIVSNPPYIDESDEHLSQGDVRFEPKSALVAASEGLADINTIVEQALQHLKANGWLLIEHGWKQGAAVQAIFQSAGFTQVRTRKDLAGQDRITEGQFVPAVKGLYE